LAGLGGVAVKLDHEVLIVFANRDCLPWSLSASLFSLH
jgi:hypothetical protein